MFRRIWLENFKGITAEYEIAKRTLFVGPNMVGKTAVLDAFRFLLGAELPSGKTNDAAAQFFAGAGGVTVEDVANQEWSASLKRRGTTISIDREAPDASAMLLNIGDFIHKSENERREFLLQLISTGDPPTRDEAVAAVKDAFAKDALGPIATAETLDKPAKLPEEHKPLTQIWKNLEEGLKAAYPRKGGSAASDVFAKFTDHAGELLRQSNRNLRDKRAAVGLLESEVRGAELTEADVEAAEAALQRAKDATTAIRCKLGESKAKVGFTEQLRAELEQIALEDIEKLRREDEGKREALKKAQEHQESLKRYLNQLRAHERWRDESEDGLMERLGNAVDVAEPSKLRDAAEAVFRRWYEAIPEEPVMDYALHQEWNHLTIESGEKMLAEYEETIGKLSADTNRLFLAIAKQQTRAELQEKLQEAIEALPAEPTATDDDLVLAIQKEKEARETFQKVQVEFENLTAWRSARTATTAEEIHQEQAKRLERVCKALRETYVADVVKKFKGAISKGLPVWAEPYIDLENVRGKPILNLGWKVDGFDVPLAAMSGAETAFYFSALAGAIAEHLPEDVVKVFLLEADALTEDRQFELMELIAGMGDVFDNVLIATSRDSEAPDGWKVEQLEFDEVAS